MKTKTTTLLIGALQVAALAAAPVYAAAYTWSGLSNPFFDNAAAWTPHAVPSTLDTAAFGPSSTYDVFYETSPEIEDLNVLAGKVSFASYINPLTGTFGPQKLYVDDTVSLPNANGNSSLTLGGTDLIPLTLNTNFLSLGNGATLTTQAGNQFNAFAAATLNGSVIVDGGGFQLGNAAGGFSANAIGFTGGNGSLTLRNGGTATIYGVLFLATDGTSSTATLNINGANSTLNLQSNSQNPAIIMVGSGTDGSATVNIGTTDSGGTLSTDNHGMTITKTGTVNVGSFLTTGILNANGDVTINGGALYVDFGSQFNLAAGKTLTINGGTADFKSYNPNGSNISFIAGSLSYAGNLLVGTAGLLGSDLTLNSDRLLSLTGTTSIDAARTLTVSGGALHTGAIVINGFLDFSSGTLATGTATLAAGGNLEIDLAGTTRNTQYGALVATGAVSLAGSLHISLLNSFMPAIGNSFDILDWGSLTGSFSSLSLPVLAAGRNWNTSLLYTTGLISVVATAGVPGDYNHNGIVDAADYVVWRNGLGTTYTQADYNVWRAHFGQSAVSGEALPSVEPRSSAVPEPATLILAGLGFLGVVVLVLRRQRQYSSVILTNCRNCSAVAFVLVLMVGAVLSSSVSASTVYSNDFESGATDFTNAGVLPALTRTSLPTDGGGLNSANQSTWLGRLGEGVTKSTSSREIVDLNVSGLTPGTVYTVAFDLLVGASWDGAADGYGTDAWYFSVDGTRLVDTMFSNGDQGVDYGAYSPQRYSDAHYADPNGPDVGAFNGAEFFRKDGPGYSGYYGIYYFSHGAGNPNLKFTATGSSVLLEWARYSGGTNFSDSPDEYWALDNVAVSSLPEPSTFVLAGLGFLSLVLRVRRTSTRNYV